LNTDEIPRGVLVMADGVTVVTGPGGPNLPGGYIQGVTAGYGSSGELLWEAFSRMATVWPTALPNGDVCAAGGYDAFITCWRVSGVIRAVLSATPSSGTAPLSVTFDGSGSTTPNGTVTSWAWSFGDGASDTGPLATHVYSTPGTYTASLTVTDSYGASSAATGSIVVNPLPPAAPSGLTASLSGYLVQLTWQDNSSNETVFYIERCAGGGCTSFASFASQWPDVPSYTDYSAISGQSYGYRVRAYNAGGYSSYSNVARIVAGGSNQPPAAVMSTNPSTGAAPLTVSFDGSRSSDSDGTVTSWAWSFGDGTTGSGSLITHLYAAPGTYIASLTVTDNGGASGTTSGSIVVQALSVDAPRNLTAVALSRSSIGLKWLNGATGQTEVRIERCRGSSCTNFSQVAALPGTATTYTDSGLAARTSYRYRVRAHSAAGDSPYSNTAGARTKG
jgi:PKD repeat protein